MGHVGLRAQGNGIYGSGHIRFTAVFGVSSSRVGARGIAVCLLLPGAAVRGGSLPSALALLNLMEWWDVGLQLRVQSRSSDSTLPSN